MLQEICSLFSNLAYSGVWLIFWYFRVVEFVQTTDSRHHGESKSWHPSITPVCYLLYQSAIFQTSLLSSKTLLSTTSDTFSRLNNVHLSHSMTYLKTCQYQMTIFLVQLYWAIQCHRTSANHKPFTLITRIKPDLII